MSAESKVGYKCSDCEVIVGEEDVDTSNSLYECGNCGSRFNRNDNGSHKCPECGKFGSKIGIACPDCGDGELEEKGDFFYCEECDEWFEYDEDAAQHNQESHGEEVEDESADS